mmetsp:Transcript_283/g.831  ORF Transcript_283/g.831 Transcript_283/m.831 type:complete len:293 (-) Transcript_283:61-939(-)
MVSKGHGTSFPKSDNHAGCWIPFVGEIFLPRLDFFFLGGSTTSCAFDNAIRLQLIHNEKIQKGRNLLEPTIPYSSGIMLSHQAHCGSFSGRRIVVGSLQSYLFQCLLETSIVKAIDIVKSGNMDMGVVMGGNHLGQIQLLCGKRSDAALMRHEGSFSPRYNGDAVARRNIFGRIAIVQRKPMTLHVGQEEFSKIVLLIQNRVQHDGPSVVGWTAIAIGGRKVVGERVQVRGGIGGAATGVLSNGLFQSRITTRIGQVTFQETKNVHVGISNNVKRQGLRRRHFGRCATQITL